MTTIVWFRQDLRLADNPALEFAAKRGRVIPVYVLEETQQPQARPIGGGAAKLRFSRKADVDAHTRLITSIYLPEEEFAVLAAVLPGVRIRKIRHTLQHLPGIQISVDEFQDQLAGLMLVEAEFETRDAGVGEAAFLCPGPDIGHESLWVGNGHRYGGAKGWNAIVCGGRADGSYTVGHGRYRSATLYGGPGA